MARLRKKLSDAVRCFRAAAAPALLAATLLLPPAAPADEAQDLKSSIVVRCIYSAGEFGNQLVDICVKEDVAAAQALRGYPRESAAIVAWCTDRLQGDGWARVRMCADENIAAETALASLDPKHATLLAECRARVGSEGAVQVRACVDQGVKSGTGD